MYVAHTPPQIARLHVREGDGDCIDRAKFVGRNQVEVTPQIAQRFVVEELHQFGRAWVSDSTVERGRYRHLIRGHRKLHEGTLRKLEHNGVWQEDGFAFKDGSCRKVVLDGIESPAHSRHRP